MRVSRASTVGNGGVVGVGVGAAHARCGGKGGICACMVDGARKRAPKTCQRVEIKNCKCSYY